MCRVRGNGELLLIAVYRGVITTNRRPTQCGHLHTESGVYGEPVGRLVLTIVTSFSGFMNSLGLRDLSLCLSVAATIVR